MQLAALRALEFDRIREALAAGALTPLGRARALALEPSGDPARVQRRLDLSGEALDFDQAGGSLAITAPEDLTDLLARLDIEDQPLDPPGLLSLARFVESVDAVASAVRQTSHRLLHEVVAGAVSFAAEVKAVRKAIEPSGDISDGASPALRDIREKLRRQRARLRSTLETLTHGRETARYLQDQIVTDRNGRYVVVVRAEHREAIPGIVHGASASGASLYVEPLSTVELNNGIVGLVEREKEEIRRILVALTDAFRMRAEDLAAVERAGADLDELYAKVQLARRLDGVAPALAADGRLEFLGARHPLLVLRGSGLFSTDSAVRGTGLSQQAPEPGGDLSPERPNLWKTDPTPSVVATDLTVVPPTRALVISGPNTGGKTVALKAIGLLALMAQAGLLVPVERGSRFTPFRSVFADIGDEQSISASLSTFSARITHIVSTDHDLDLPALVLLDEAGGGTDPAEGGALGTAIIDHFRQRGALVVATTHDDAIKSYAATTEGVATAAFGFDPDTYVPTYRLMYGAPGRSLAFEIAERLGMPPEVIQSARARQTSRESQLAAHLARVDQEIAALERERSLVQGDRDAIAQERRRVLDHEARLAEREAVLKKRLDERLNEKLRDAREEVDRIVGRLKEKAGVLAERARPLSTGEIGNLRVEGRVALDAVATGAGTGAASAIPDQRLDGPPAVGQPVYVASFGAEGIVRGVSGRNVEVEIRGKRTRVPVSGLRRATSPPRSQGGPEAGKAPRRPSAAVTRPAAGLAQATRELVLVGSTVDEAIDRVEKFLDDALLADERRLRVVHGHGTGRLREALRTYFRGHPLVASAAPAPDNEGGDGATIVELKE